MTRPTEAERSAPGGATHVALVPAHNEQETIGATVAGLKRAIPEIMIVAVDDGSTDLTAENARASGAGVISLPRNIGKGNALNHAFDELGLDDSAIVLLVDADVGETSAQARVLVDSVEAGRCDMAIARFTSEKPGGFGLARAVAAWGIRTLAGLDTTVPLSGQRAMRAALWRSVGGLESGYGMEVGLTIEAARRGYRIVEIDAPIYHLGTGRDLAGFKHRGRQLYHICLALWRKRSRGEHGY